MRYWNTGESNATDGRPAFMITSLHDVEVLGDSVIVDGQTWGDGFGPSGKEITESVNAGIIIAKGNVTIRNGADFWGTIIAQGDIIIENNSQVYAASSDIRKLIQVNTLVIPYFSKDTGGKKENGDPSSSDLVDVIYDNWRKN